ncbi:hypothetical protein D6029_17195 [Buttiauxella izardii]|uniref:Uncharacterized protein n=1 Tax=Buttiauxella izardii TaxID=82991 RepID=A0A3A5JUJ4_9ENTR|nr:hypothetical protein D6029_17195 [Buttiauxella izardii]
MEVISTGAAYVAPYSFSLLLISLIHIDMRFPYFRITSKQVCWAGFPNFIQLRTGYEQDL